MTLAVRCRLDALLPELNDVPPIVVSGMSDDSRDVRPGDVFVAVAGAASDGHDHVDDAVSRGAVAVLAERPLPAALTVPVLVVPALRRRRSALAGCLYGDPSRHLHGVGVTGTNGKTSTALHVADLARRLGQATGYLGTLGWGRWQPPEPLAPSRLTTAGAIDTQRRLAELVAAGCRWVALEASSHALDQGRLDGVTLRAAVFTNLTRDHLDYHSDLQAYGAAKAQLFELPGLATAVVNVDDAFGRTLADHLACRDGLRLLRCGAGLSGDGAIGWRDLVFDESGIHGRWLTPWGDAPLRLPLCGEFSVANMAAAIAVLCDAGHALTAVLTAAAEVQGVPGRMEFFRAPGRPSVVVDYAHTPDALGKALAALRAHARGRLYCVVGCGGNRDRGKRPQMARAAAAADRVWLTSDNPRFEDPLAILDDMRTGLDDPAAAEVEPDRRQAIAAAFAAARPGDIVLVAGKGHEDYQEVAGVRQPFSDRELARTLLGDAGTVEG